MLSIDAQSAWQKVQEGKAIVVDVREPDEIASMSVPDSLRIPLDQLPSRFNEIPKDREVLFLCRSGRRSEIACQQVSSGMPNAKSVSGGILAWEKAGGAVTVRSRVIPLMRQVQIVAGSLVVLGFFIKPIWFLVPIVGLGLIFAGVSGFCGMAKFLQLMPWNRHSNR